jgi:hypothetical protein
MSNSQEEIDNNNLISSKIKNGLNDEEIIINDKDTENNENYQYYESNKLFNNENNYPEGELEEDSDDTIVAFQEEKNSNLIESRDNIFSKDSTNENDLNIEYEKEEKDIIQGNKTEKIKSNEINNNIKIKNSFSHKISLKKRKKRRKKTKMKKTKK